MLITQHIQIRKITRRDALKLGLSGLFALKIVGVQAQTSRDTSPFSYLTVNKDGIITLACPFVEGGQGIFTGLAQIVAEEMNVDPKNFHVHCPPSDPNLNLINGLRFTGGSLSIRSAFPVYRQIGATARLMFLQAAAQKLKVPLAELDTNQGLVVHARTKQSLPYGALASAASTLPVPMAVSLKNPDQFRLIGKSVQRLDVVAKSTGAARYAIDMSVPDMWLAAIQHRPNAAQMAGSVENIKDILAMSGVKAVEIFPDFVAVIAERWWQAKKAIEAARVQWVKRPDAAALPSSDLYLKELVTQAQAETGFAQDTTHQKKEAVYSFPCLAHAQLEPPSALARFQPNGSLDIWTPNQSPDMFRDAIAKLANLEPAKITIHSNFVGGFFGRFAYYGLPNPVYEAVILAQKMKRPIKVIWSRENEFSHDAYRPMTVVKMAAAYHRDQRALKGMEAYAFGEGATGHIFGFSGSAPDESAVEGLLPTIYSFPSRAVTHRLTKSPFKIGYWRSVGFSSNVFATECFMDEMAHELGSDPISFRLAHLGNDPRAAKVLQAVVQHAGGLPSQAYQRPDGTLCARGVALTYCFGSYVANIVEVSLQSQRPLVEKVWAAVDAGIVINPALVIDQIRSGIILGLSAALYEQIDITKGEASAKNFDAYPVMPPNEAPPVSVHLIPSQSDPGGVGEIGLPALAPAISNALFVLTQKRLRDLPFSKAGPLTAQR